MRRLVLACLALLALPATASAAPPCPDAPAPRQVLSGQGVLEAITANRDALFISNSSQDAVVRLDSPAGAPRVLAPVPAPGGLVFDRDGTLVAGTGNDLGQGAVGNVTGLASLLRLDPVTGASSVFATGLQMANGVTRGRDGTFYASNDVGAAGIDRVSAAGTVERAWAGVVSPNGLAVSSDGRWLYAAQTFQPAAIKRVEIANPANVETYAQPGPEDIADGPDAMTRDADDNLYVAANGGGEVWRVGTDRSICALATGLTLPSAVSFGGGGAFPKTSLYVVTFNGDLIELPGVLGGGRR